MEYIKILFAVIIAVVGWIVAHYYTSKRDTNNYRRATRIEALSFCYKAFIRSGLDGALIVEDEAGKAINKAIPVEDAIALIHLYGSQEQSDLANIYANEISEKKNADSTALVNSLRSDIREMLGLPNVEGNPAFLRVTINKQTQ